MASFTLNSLFFAFNYSILSQTIFDFKSCKNCKKNARIAFAFPSLKSADGISAASLPPSFRRAPGPELFPK